MSNGGTYTIITNQSHSSGLLLEPELFKTKIQAWMCKKVSTAIDKEIMARRINLDKKTPDEIQTMRNKIGQEISNKSSDWVPTLHDITSHQVFMDSTFKPSISVGSEYQKIAPNGGTAASLGNKIIFTVANSGEFIQDMVLNLKLNGLIANNAADKVRYVEMLGHRLLKTCTFKVANNIIDTYTPEIANIHYQFHVPQHKEEGYLRMIGQEIPNVGFITADPTTDEVRKYVTYGSGPQTFKYNQGTLELFIPLRFWTSDIRTALPNYLLRSGSVTIEIEFESDTNLIAYANYSGTTGAVYTAPTVRDCVLYVNNIYVHPDVKRILPKRQTEQLIRVHRYQKFSGVVSATNKIVLNSIQWPAEQLFVGFQPSDNSTDSRKWHRQSYLTTVNPKEAVVTGVATIQVNTAAYYTETPIVASATIRAEDTTLFPITTTPFFNQYMPYQYGETHKTPKDQGWLLFNFSRYPDKFDPSGHFDATSTREIVLDYTSAVNSSSVNYITTGTPCTITVVAVCRNLLVCKDNSAILRYS